VKPGDGMPCVSPPHGSLSGKCMAFLHVSIPVIVQCDDDVLSSRISRARSALLERQTSLANLSRSYMQAEVRVQGPAPGLQGQGQGAAQLTGQGRPEAGQVGSRICFAANPSFMGTSTEVYVLPGVCVSTVSALHQHSGTTWQTSAAARLPARADLLLEPPVMLCMAVTT